LARSRATRNGRRRPALAMPRNSDPTRSASVTRPNIAPADSNANLKRSATRSASSKSSRPSKPPEQPQSQPPCCRRPRRFDRACPNAAANSGIHRPASSRLACGRCARGRGRAGNRSGRGLFTDPFRPSLEHGAARQARPARRGRARRRRGLPTRLRGVGLALRASPAPPLARRPGRRGGRRRDGLSDDCCA
jgi:hypothetical protein